MKIRLFTHCDLDGVGCAILAYLAFGHENVDVEYCDYKDVDEKVRKFWKGFHDAKYDSVFITDISISDDLAHEIQECNCKKDWKLFDHHATALGLNKYDWCKVKIWYDDGIPTSGTELFYNYLIYHAYLCPANTPLSVIKNIERFVKIVRDYDTWRWKELGEKGIVCKQVNDLFYIYGRDNFIAWAIGRNHDILRTPFPSFDATDEFLLNQKQKDIDIYIEQKDKQLRTFWDEFDNEYGVVFAERYFSELGNRLCELHPELAYVAMIDICNGKISFRTTRDNIDLGGEIAHSFGGGGHRKSAGSTFDVHDIQTTVIDELFGLKEG